MQILEPLIVAGKQPILTEHLELAFCDFPCFLQLSRVKLNDIIASNLLVLNLVTERVSNVLAALCLLVVIRLLRTLLLLDAVLLGNFILHDVDGAAL